MVCGMTSETGDDDLSLVSRALSASSRPRLLTTLGFRIRIVPSFNPPFKQLELPNWRQTSRESAVRMDARAPLSTHPLDSQDATRFSWVVSISDALGGADDRSVSTSCINDSESCPVLTRVDMTEGELESCHFPHRHGADGRDYLTAMEFGSIDGEGPPTRLAGAVADAVQLKMEDIGSLELEVSSRQGELLATYHLTPDEEGSITVFLVNVPVSSVERGVCPEGTTSQHYWNYYRLLDSPPPTTSRPVPRETGAGYACASEGCELYNACEREILALRASLEQINTLGALQKSGFRTKFIPHDPEECIGTQIP